MKEACKQRSLLLATQVQCCNKAKTEYKDAKRLITIIFDRHSLVAVKSQHYIRFESKKLGDTSFSHLLALEKARPKKSVTAIFEYEDEVQ